ncbi:variant erythrocyte surface antigen-1 family protein [Babesia caballi]|uniref:Variant erythrocyte surface antigen-1 family protein n=1 Tax=Babesia caballi TaxID=5871 RepID=A0AAV4M0V8_BABCB|nr:variant erythrocyte surface antigen-1 family protein [Babesia caballi]
MATHRLCDATIAFTIGVLEGCKGKVGGGHVTTLNGVITKLYAKYGTGTEGLQGVAGEVKSGLQQINGSSVRQFLQDIYHAFDTLNGLSDDASTVAEKVGAYLKGAFKGNNGSRQWKGDADQAAQKLQALVQKFKSNNTYNTNDNSFSQNVKSVETALKPGSHSTVKPILTAGKNAFLGALKMPNYTRMDYDASSVKWTHSDTPDVKTCAKIFLGCLPLYYQALTYIYWGSKTGAQIAKSALGRFTEFGKASSSLKDSNSPYVKFTKKLQEVVTKNGGQPSDSCPLSALFYGASCYFRYQQITTAKSAFNTPKTIREMLYFLSALQFSSAYDELNEHIGTVLTTELSVADSSDRNSNNTLSATQLKEYLRASCAFSPSVLGLIQGPGATENTSDPWLFELFCNSAFQFKYPSGAALFSKVSNYAYALQFQLGFLYSTCGNIGVKCGWQECTYGKEMNPKGSGNSPQSHICPGLKCNTSNCNHNSGQCNHNKYSQSEGCGKSASTPSPLQAFIIGTLPSFGLSSSSTTNHMSDHPQGALCHVPMGFQANHLRSIGNGAVVYLVLKPICGNFSSPLRQLCEKLGCLTKRTPRSLGDMFGFTWHLKGQLSNTLSSLQSAQWFGELKDKLPFSYELENDSGENLKKFVGTDHKAHNSSPADLTALHSSGCNKSSQTCGPYLSPLTLSHGATFGKPAPYASTYLSWMAYLTDDLQSQFQEMLEEFKNIDCSKTGCRGKAGSQQACTSHTPGTHSTSNECKCDSVVRCGGVLPLLYRYGFTFSDMGALFGEGNTGNNTKRNCKAFADQLQSVISGNPLNKLLESIDNFLFLFRYYFLSNLSGFWAIYIGLILYTFFFLLDTLHLRSHLKLTSSHPVPPLSLLTSGSPLPVTKLTYITQ